MTETKRRYGPIETMTRLALFAAACFIGGVAIDPMMAMADFVAAERAGVIFC